MRTVPEPLGTTASLDAKSYTVAQAAARLGLSVTRTRRLIWSRKLASTKSGWRRYVPASAIAEFEAAARARRQAREQALLAAAPTDWDWEGNLVDSLADWLKELGWQEVSRASAALREHGVDLVMERDGRTRIIEVKGWPSSKHTSGPKKGRLKRWRPTMGRNYVGDLVLSAMILRSSRPDDEVAISVPERETFLNLLERIRPSLELLGIGAYVISENGEVRPFLAVEDVDQGRDARDRAVDRTVVRRLVEMSDIQREAHYISSNRAALEMLADARGR